MSRCKQKITLADGKEIPCTGMRMNGAVYGGCSQQCDFVKNDSLEPAAIASRIHELEESLRRIQRIATDPLIHATIVNAGIKPEKE